MVADEGSSACRRLVPVGRLMRVCFVITTILYLSANQIVILSADKYLDRKQVKLLRCARVGSASRIAKTSENKADQYVSTVGAPELARDTKMLIVEHEMLPTSQEEESLDNIDEEHDQDWRIDGRSARLKRFAVRQAAGTNSSLNSLISNLAQATRQQQVSGSSGLNQLAATGSSLAGLLLRQGSADLQVTLENGIKLLLNLLASLTVNNPLIINSPTLTRLRGSSQPANATQLEALLQILRVLSRPAASERPQIDEPTSTSSSAEPLLPDLAVDTRFVERLNELTLRDVSVRPNRRSKRSIGSMLLMGSPLGKLYMGVWLHRLMRQQTSVLSQVLMGELVRRYLLPAVLPGASGVLSAARAHGADLSSQREQLNQTVRLASDATECEPLEPIGTRTRGHPLHNLVLSAVESPLVSMNQEGVSVRLPSGQVSVAHLAPELYGSLSRALERAPTVASSGELEQLAAAARQLEPAHLLGLVSSAGPVGDRSASQAAKSRQVQVSLSADSATSLMDMIGRLALNSSSQPRVELRKTMSQLEEVRPGGKRADSAELSRTLSALGQVSAIANASARAQLGSSRTTNVVNLRVQQTLASPRQLARPTKVESGRQPSDDRPLPAHNHRNGRLEPSARLQVGSARPTNYLFAPLNALEASKLDEDPERGEHAARWNDVLAHLGDNLSSNKTSSEPQ